MANLRYHQSAKSAPEAVRKQWAAFVQTGLKARSAKQLDIAAKMGCSPSLVCRMADGFVPCREKARRFGEAIGNTSGALVAAGFAPEAGLENPFSDNVRELLCILTFLPQEEQDGLISVRVLEAVQTRIAHLSKGRQQAC